MNVRQLGSLVKDAFSSWSADFAPSMGAALAYYTLFSIAPLLLIVISVAGLVFGEDVARQETFDQLRSLMGEQGATAVQGLLRSVSKPREGIIATLIGVVVMLVGATTVFTELQNSLDRIWRAPPPQYSGVWRMLRSRLRGLAMILGIGILLMLSLLASAALSALGAWFSPSFGSWALVGQVANFVISVALITLMFALVYKVMPRVHVRWPDVWIGAAVTALLFTIGKTLLGLYIGKTGFASGYGAAGSLVVMLFWMYYSAQIFLLGAEFSSLYAHTYGSRRGLARPAAPTSAAAPATSAASAAAAASAVPGASAAPAAPAAGVRASSGRSGGRKARKPRKPH
jgi:membrane protein